MKSFIPGPRMRARGLRVSVKRGYVPALAAMGLSLALGGAPVHASGQAAHRVGPSSVPAGAVTAWVRRLAPTVMASKVGATPACVAVRPHCAPALPQPGTRVPLVSPRPKPVD